MDSAPLDQLSQSEATWKAGQLASDLPAFAAETTCQQVFHHFREQREQVAAAVLDNDGAVVGIVNRLRFLARYAQPYVPELFSKKPVTKLANLNPLVVDENLSLVQLGNMLTFDWPDALRECFVITRGGKYLGIGTSEALVRAKLGMVASREAQLRNALCSAQRANEAKSNFLALMSHELRTPLNAIIGFSEVLSTELFGPHGVARYLEYSKDIHGAGNHLLALINDILDLSKSEAGKLELYPEEISVDELFADCLRLIASRAAGQDIALRSEIGGHGLRLRADRLRMKQILLNLLSNAVKFTLTGGQVVLSAAMRPGGGVCLSVADTGIGMSPESIPLALEPFRQIDSPMSRTVEGTGLGLSLVKTLVEQHGGTLDIESALSKGTTVHVNLPASAVVTNTAELRRSA
jgi:two-component system cell cycle sensor histidine kinase PleC